MKYLNLSYASAASQQPLPSVSLDFIQSGIKELSFLQTSAIWYALTSNTIGSTSSKFVISGCAKTQTGAGPYTVTVGTGSIFYDGEVMKVNYTQFTVPSTLNYDVYVRPTTYNNPAIDPIQFSDYITRNVHDDKYLTVLIATASGTTPTAPSGSVALSAIQTYLSVPEQCNNAAFSGAFLAQSYGLTPNYQNISSVVTAGVGGWTYSTESLYIPQIAYEVNTGRVVMTGKMHCIDSSLSGGIMFTLPTTYRPVYTKHIPVSTMINGTYSFMNMKVNPNGQIYLMFSGTSQYATASATNWVDLSNISYVKW